MSTQLSNQAQLRYLIEWFQEWSEMQRGDFLDILVACCGPPDLVNGLLSSIEKLMCNEESTRPPSLFQCRVKLFQEWCQNWSQQDKEFLLTSIKNIDPKFAERYERRLTNGNVEEEEEEEKEEVEENGLPESNACPSPVKVSSAEDES
uniref:Uncharacterized protein n=1 Tax=Bracon brevicornis TaxID=1563983 RepID=A0A6V7IN78_9HYME